MVSSEYPQALRSPQVSADTIKIGYVTINAAETDLITVQSNALYLESISVTFYTSADVEVPTATLKVYLDVTDQATPTITLTPNDLRTKAKIANLGNFQLMSQSPGSISIQPINPLATSFLKITGQGLSAGDKCYRAIVWRV